MDWGIVGTGMTNDSLYAGFLSVLLTASKQVLNNMLREPSLIPDQALANHVYQVFELYVYTVANNIIPHRNLIVTEIVNVCYLF